MTTLRTYYLLTKPGIIVGNLITTVGGVALASRGHIDPWLFLVTLVGLGLVIASACVFNNYVDRFTDEKMARTKNRALAKGLISGKSAIVFAALMGVCGMLILSLFTNLLATSIAFLGFFIYVVLYSFWKYHTTYATLVGSIAGAIPPVVGYAAVANRLDAGAILLFMILVLWQMPHFFAIAMYRFDDYLAASIPVMPVQKGIFRTKVHMLLYIIAFTATCLMLTFFGYMGTTYAIVAAVLGVAWIWLSIQGFKSHDDKLWARKMFLLSLCAIIAICIMIPVNYTL